MASELRLGFLCSARFENSEVTRGGILVTDAETKPLEFRCTGPIRPTNFQKVLYGSVLDSHILVELVGVALLNSLTEKPSALLVRESALVYLQPKMEPTVLLLSKHGEFDAPESTTPGASSLPDKLLTSASGKFEPIILHCYKGYHEHAAHIRADLSSVFAHYDLLEPFDRIRSALEVVHKQRVGEQK